jgi:hypothetical protein
LEVVAAMLTKIKCSQPDCTNKDGKYCGADYVDQDWYEGICKMYQATDDTMRKTDSLHNRAKLK